MHATAGNSVAGSRAVLQRLQHGSQPLQRCSCVTVHAAKGFGTMARKGFGLVKKQDFWG
jgi:hypothetical protein